MKSILNRLKPDAATLRARLAELDAAAPALRTTLAGLQAARGATLLDGTPTEIADAEVRLREAREALERNEAASATLRDRIAVADRAESAAALERQRADLEREAEAIAVAMRDRYPALAAEMADLCRRESDWEQAARRYHEAQSEAASRGITDRAPGLVAPHHRLGHVDPGVGGLSARLVIPSLDRSHPTLWPPARVVA